jgi:hypothetical protein
MAEPCEVKIVKTIHIIILCITSEYPNKGLYVNAHKFIKIADNKKFNQNIFLIFDEIFFVKELNLSNLVNFDNRIDEIILTKTTTKLIIVLITIEFWNVLRKTIMITVTAIINKDTKIDINLLPIFVHREI